MREPYALKGARTVPGRGCGSNPAPLFDGRYRRLQEEPVYPQRCAGREVGSQYLFQDMGVQQAVHFIWKSL